MQKSPGLPRVVVAHPSESSATSSSESEEGVEKPRRQLTFAEDVIAQEEDFSTDEEAVDGEEESEGGETDTSEVAVVKYPVQPIVQPVPCQPKDHPSLTREPSQKSVITTDGDDDWAHRHQGKHGKVSDLISRFNNGTDVSKTSTSYATYKYEYGVNRHPGRIEQNKFH